jgi:hypothetical protein
MVMNSFGKRNFMQPMARIGMQSWWALFFHFGGGEELFFVFLPCSQCVPNMFSYCSFEVLKLFLKVFPTAPQFYLIWCARSSIFMCINWKGRLLGNTFVSVLQLGGPKRCFHWGVLNVPKKLLISQWM